MLSRATTATPERASQRFRPGRAGLTLTLTGRAGVNERTDARGGEEMGEGKATGTTADSGFASAGGNSSLESATVDGCALGSVTRITRDSMLD
jgi:hypothetical protein